MKDSTLRTFVTNCLLASAILSLSACAPWEWFKETFLGKKEASPTETVEKTAAEPSETLVSIDGRPLVTVDNWNEHLKFRIQQQPELGGVIQSMPNLEYEIFKTYVAPTIAQEWVKKTGKDKSSEYQNRYRMITEEIERQLALEALQEDIIKGIETSDATLRSFYESSIRPEDGEVAQAFQNKVFFKEPGGVTLASIEFDDEEEARDFLAKAQEAVKEGREFKAVASEEGLEAKEHGLVTLETKDVDHVVKQHALGMNQGDTKLIQSMKGGWQVAHALAKQEPTFKDYDELANNPQFAEYIKNQYIQSVGSKAFEDKLEALRKELNISENTGYFERKMKEKEEEVKKLQEEARKQATAAGGDQEADEEGLV